MSKNVKENMPTWLSVLFVCVMVPGVFYYRFGKVDAYGIGVTIFIVSTLVIPLWMNRFNEHNEPDPEVQNIPPGRFDWLVPVWGLLIPFGPLILWGINNLTVSTWQNYNLILGAKVLVCVVLPLICGLPMYKYMRGKYVYISVLIFTIGTGIPLMVGYNSFMDLVNGPKSEVTEIIEVKRFSLQDRSGRSRSSSLLEVKLSNGRKLDANIKAVNPKKGQATVLYLDKNNLLIGVK
jgi:hypothetical protein